MKIYAVLFLFAFSSFAGPGTGRMNGNQRFNRPCRNCNRPGQWQKPGGQKPGGQFQKPGGQFQKPGGQFQKPGGQFQRPGGQFQKPGGQFQKPGGQFQKPGGQFQRPGGQFQKPGGQWPKPEGNKATAKPAPTGKCSCGCVPSSGGARIVGGSVAKESSWPWQIRLVTRKDKGFGTCGGSLIADKWVLTAVHCVQSQNVQDYTVYAGMHEIEEQRTGEAQRIGVAEIYRRIDTIIIGGDDIALIKLTSAPSFGRDVQKVCLPADDSADVVEGTKMTVTGWGKTSLTTGPSSVLKQVTIDVLGSANGQCKTENEICAPHVQTGQSAFKGDSGGPLVRKRGTNWFQFGIVSGNPNAKDPNSPTRYVRVSAHCNWIQEKTGIQICK